MVELIREIAVQIATVGVRASLRGEPVGVDGGEEEQARVAGERDGGVGVFDVVVERDVDVEGLDETGDERAVRSRAGRGEAHEPRESEDELAARGLVAVHVADEDEGGLGLDATGLGGDLEHADVLAFRASADGGERGETGARARVQIFERGGELVVRAVTPLGPVHARDGRGAEKGAAGSEGTRGAVRPGDRGRHTGRVRRGRRSREEDDRQRERREDAEASA